LPVLSKFHHENQLALGGFWNWPMVVVWCWYPAPLKKQKTDGSLIRVSKLGTGGCRERNPKYPLFTRGIRIGFSGGLRSSLLRPLFARALSLATRPSTLRLLRENHAWCAFVSFPRVVYVACFRTWKERSSPVCISLWFSRTCKTGVRGFPALICFNPWWCCGAVSRFWDLETVRDCLLKAVSEVTVCVSRSTSMLLERWTSFED
jgi:hypothetical protein